VEIRRNYSSCEASNYLLAIIIKKKYIRTTEILTVVNISIQKSQVFPSCCIDLQSYNYFMTVINIIILLEFYKTFII